MKKLIVLSLTVLCIVSLILTGCATSGDKTTTGALTGALIGGAAGAIAGHETGHTLGGAAIGAGIGALSGGLIGYAMEDKQKESNPDYLSLSDIARMASEGVPDSVIIDEIRKTKSVYRLDPETTDYLKKNKVSDRVIDYMNGTSR